MLRLSCLSPGSLPAATKPCHPICGQNQRKQSQWSDWMNHIPEASWAQRSKIQLRVMRLLRAWQSAPAKLSHPISKQKGHGANCWASGVCKSPCPIHAAPSDLQPKTKEMRPIARPGAPYSWFELQSKVQNRASNAAVGQVLAPWMTLWPFWCPGCRAQAPKRRKFGSRSIHVGLKRAPNEPLLGRRRTWPKHPYLPCFRVLGWTLERIGRLKNAFRGLPKGK